MDLPQDLIVLVIEFTGYEDIDALPLYHTCREFRDLVAEMQRKRLPDLRSLFCNLSVKSLKHLSIIQAKWLIGVGASPVDIQAILCNTGNLEVLVQLENCIRYSWEITCAAKGGHLEVIKWLRENGCPWDPFAIAYAAEGGHLEVIKWLRENGCPWDSEAVACAAEGGYLAVIKWLRENGCAWSDSAVAYAAEGGHLEVVKWLRANGCPWSPLAVAYAAEGGHLEVIKWLRENGCAWSYTAVEHASTEGHQEVLEWLRANGCPE